MVVGAHTARVGGRNKLARKENSDGPNAHTPRQATSVWSVSEMKVFPAVTVSFKCGPLLAQVDYFGPAIGDDSGIGDLRVKLRPSNGLFRSVSDNPKSHADGDARRYPQPHVSHRYSQRGTDASPDRYAYR